MRTVPAHIRKKKHPAQPSPITDHAIVQFLDRTGVVDIKSLRRYFMTKRLCAALKESKSRGNVNYLHFENGLVFYCREGRVMTVLPEDMMRDRRGDIPSIMT